MITLDGREVDGVPARLALYPYGVFTTFVVDGGTVLGWEAHRARLAHDARALWGHDVDDEHLRGVVRAHVDRLDGPATVRVTLYPAELALASPASARGCTVLVSSAPADPAPVPDHLAVRTVDHARESPSLKSTALLGAIRLRREAQLAGFDDVLFVRDHEVLEGATWTLLAWHDDEVATPDAGVLRSITADHLAAVAAELGRPMRRRPVSVDELAEARLVTAVNVNRPARAIIRVDDVILSPDDDLLAAVATGYAALPRQPLR